MWTKWNDEYTSNFNLCNISLMEEFWLNNEKDSNWVRTTLIPNCNTITYVQLFTMFYESHSIVKQFTSIQPFHSYCSVNELFSFIEYTHLHNDFRNECEVNTQFELFNERRKMIFYIFDV